MSKSRKSVTGLENLMQLQAIQEMRCWDQAKKQKEKVAETPVAKKVNTKQAEIEACYDAQKPSRSVSKDERQYLRSLHFGL